MRPSVRMPRRGRRAPMEIVSGTRPKACIVPAVPVHLVQHPVTQDALTSPARQEHDAEPVSAAGASRQPHPRDRGDAEAADDAGARRDAARAGPGRSARRERRRRAGAARRARNGGRGARDAARTRASATSDFSATSTPAIASQYYSKLPADLSRSTALDRRSHARDGRQRGRGDRRARDTPASATSGSSASSRRPKGSRRSRRRRRRSTSSRRRSIAA